MQRDVVFRAAGMLTAALLSVTAGTARAGAELSAGVWWVYQNTLESDFSGPSSAFDENLDAETGGSFADPALVVYGSDDGSHGPWHFSAEMRIGTGSFSAPSRNNSGDNFTMHKAWIGYDLNENNSLKIGKSQVPFGWKTSNFWPGDILQGGYGDQMDVGLKLSGSQSRLSYDLAYYHQDDWGETSTDTVDDNGHWGTQGTFDPDGVPGNADDYTSASYRKIKTGVVNLDFELTAAHTLGVSYQRGRMQDLSAQTAAAQNDDGKHDAVDLHYYFTHKGFNFKYRYIDASRDFSDMTSLLANCTSCPADTDVETTRHVAHLSLRKDRWNYYIEASRASTDTRNNLAENVEAYAPGVSYQYGPGWLYLEYLWQNGDIGSYGDVYEADFRTIYASFDFYF
ncbi:MAG: hypothetical protein P1U64_01745 [Alcanivoracaceae bacterium]|nr:hypothetical protein [Alcanivoracaceae bacterium]